MVRFGLEKKKKVGWKDQAYGIEWKIVRGGFFQMKLLIINYNLKLWFI